MATPFAHRGAAIVRGAENNQLALPDDGRALARRDILYAPDYLVNAGGIINVAGEYFGWSQVEVRERVDQIGARLAQVLDFAEVRQISPHEAANTMAAAIFEGNAQAATSSADRAMQASSSDAQRASGP